MSEEDEKHQKETWMIVALVFIGFGVLTVILGIVLIIRNRKLAGEIKKLKEELDYVKKHPHCDCLITTEIKENAEKAAEVLKDYSNRIKKASTAARYIAPVEIEIQSCKEPTKYTIAPTGCSGDSVCAVPAKPDTKVVPKTAKATEPPPPAGGSQVSFFAPVPGYPVYPQYPPPIKPRPAAATEAQE